MYAIYNKLNNKVISRFDGQESKISDVYDLNQFGYILTNDSELYGDVNEFIVENGKVVRRNIDEIINEAETRNPIPRNVKSLQNENAEIWYQNMILEGNVNSEFADVWYAIMTGGSV